MKSRGMEKYGIYEKYQLFFVPFKYEKYERFKDLTRMLDESDSWDLVHDEIIYMMKYVADKLDSRKPEQCLCFHYEWNGRKEKIFQD